jgi:hypothetical protein
VAASVRRPDLAARRITVMLQRNAVQALRDVPSYFNSGATQRIPL